MMHSGYGWEEAVIRWFAEIANPACDSIMSAVTYCATYSAIWIIIGIIMLSSRRGRQHVPALVVSILLAYLVCDFILKPMVGRIRPFDAMDLDTVVTVSSTFSFPSGHTASSFAAATVLLMFDRRIGCISLMFAALVGLSRIYLLVHWPTDVVCGAIIGMLCALFVSVVFRMLHSNGTRYEDSS